MLTGPIPSLLNEPQDKRSPCPTSATGGAPGRRCRWYRRAIRRLLVLLVVYLALAYGVVPALWSHLARRHPSVDDLPPITHTKNHIPGDPVNVGLIGTQVQVV